MTGNQRYTERRESRRPPGEPMSLLDLEPRFLAGLADRFWSRIDTSGGADACWPWTGRRDPRAGYGSLNIGRRRFRASRVAFELTYGRLEHGACHHCDNPPCCNPSHLFDGTQTDNLGDAATKGRIASGERHGLVRHPDAVERGERHHAARLTEANVLRLRDAAAQGSEYEGLAAVLGVSRFTVSEIARGRKWTHVGGPRTHRRIRRAA